MKNNIENIDKQISQLRDVIKKLTNKKTSIKKAMQKSLLEHATLKAKFKVGDIIDYYETNKLLLITSIHNYEDGDPFYKGFEIGVKGNLTRSVNSTYGWGHDYDKTQNGTTYKTRFKKVGSAESFILSK